MKVLRVPNLLGRMLPDNLVHLSLLPRSKLCANSAPSPALSLLGSLSDSLPFLCPRAAGCGFLSSTNGWNLGLKHSACPSSPTPPTSRAPHNVSFFTSLWNHPFFTISCITLIGLFFAGIHKRVVAPSIIAARCRTVLAEYNMSCDDTGKLILKPRPHVQ
ncbi:nuclear envelope phosphatase-regulatory subunit 1 isoform X1 [Manis javanica]|uniref:nuclear envelope phosphatase-regulatory subunit 1 isoform X1 n=1 Tax=Manis javanica TaxID=9974 RepID=UPI003C6CF952